MRWFSDRTGFPVLELPELDVAAHFWPVSKLQFERFLAEPVLELAEPPQPALYGDAWYESLLAVLPRVPLREAPPDRYEAQFLAGILPEEVGKFARWLGAGYDLPQVETWRHIDDALADAPFTDRDADALRSDDRFARSARALLDWWLIARRPRTWGELALFQGGLLEWVRTGHQGFGGLGRPRPEFQRLLLNPQRDEPVRPIRKGRFRYFGFRLVRPL